ncbi:hypothetical protein [Comamonas testosteroni]|uniref:hypothetical protein n=1 Tax=Comamonas testosteroni TaxID=285 RepID=UPI003919B251
MVDLSPLLKVSARLLDLHDSNRGPGSPTQYQLEERPGLKDGRYVAIAGEVLIALQESGKQFGDEYASLDFVVLQVRAALDRAHEMDIEYVLNVLSRPTELRLLQGDEDSTHVIGDKDTNLVEKAAHVSEFRLSRLGRKALAMAADNLDLAYIEGDITKLLRALETGKLEQAMRFLDRLIDQLRTEQLELISVMERSAGGRRVLGALFDDIEAFEATMRRAAEMVHKAQAQISVLAKDEGPKNVDQDVPLGLVKDRVRELQRGIVGYSRCLSELATMSLGASSTSVPPPAFAELALRMVVSPPSKIQSDFLLSQMGPVFPHVIQPTVTDWRHTIKSKVSKPAEMSNMDLGKFDLPPEDRFLEWMGRNQAAFNQALLQGELTMADAIKRWAAEDGTDGDFVCVVAALTSPDEWLTVEGASGVMERSLAIFSLQSADVMHSRLTLSITNPTLAEETPNDTL